MALYIHIPFCKSKCPYCDFNSRPVSSIPEDYIDTLIKELAIISKREDVENRFTSLKSVYIGGGTPSLLSPNSIQALLTNVYDRIAPTDNIEVTLEANPGTVNLKKLKGYKKAGINRLSLGIQSFNEEDLKTLGRTHDATASGSAFHDARDAGFDNISVDLIFALPGQEMTAWESTLSRAIELRPEHLSVYGLTIEEGTPFHKALKNGELTLPPEELQTEMYKRGMTLLKDNGYTHYEISNLALPGFESIHNSNYWLGGNYIGLGAGAHSYLKDPEWGRRWWNERDPKQYIELVKKGNGKHISGTEDLDRKEALTEALFLGLRKIHGIDEAAFKARFNIYPKEALEWKRLKDLGLVRSEGGRTMLTEKGILLSNEVFSSTITL